MKFTFKEINTKSNLISLIRLLMAIPLFILTGNIEEYRIFLIILMIVGCFTDFLDGYLARKYNEVTEFGKIIDPLADKVAISAVVLQLFLSGLIPSGYFAIIILRDIIIFLGGIYVSKKINKVLPSNLLGKITVFFISIFMILIVAGLNKNNFLYDALMYLTILLSIFSVIGYFIRGYDSLKWKKKNEII